MWHLALLLHVVVASALQIFPPVNWSAQDPNSPGFDVTAVEHNIYITNAFASHRDEQGLTLIPPSAAEFANTFRQDLEEVTESSWALHAVDSFPPGKSGIFLDSLSGSREPLTYENGEPTEEGYELDVQPERILIRGSGARGMWWGTRTLLQQLLISDHQPIRTGLIVDAPSVSTRGYLLDAGRKWYSPQFLKDLCTYASFFKMSEFHYHTSDNYPLNRGHNETWQDVYAQFALRPDNPDLQGLVQRENETLSRVDFEDLQQHCAQRGVTVIPEIEAPGHCLFVTKWKPYLALEEDKDLLNLTHPETVPLVKSIWEEFLPWFQSKEVHIGADEYDSTLADDYIDFVNEMSRFIHEQSGKRVRIWGTDEPSPTGKEISKDIIIQHWQYGQSDPVALSRAGYSLINSEDWWAYMSLKNDHMPILPAPYPPFFNNTRILNFGEQEGVQWTPNSFNPVNSTEKPQQHVKGAVVAAWNDNGPDATTQLEAFYALRDGIPTGASRSWTGTRGPRIEERELSASLEILTSKAVAQNLDRRMINPEPDRTNEDTLLDWTAPEHHDNTHPVHLHHGSKGMNYTLDLDVTGPFTLSSNDTTLQLSSSGTLTFFSDGWPYPLRSISPIDGFDPSFPGRIWSNQTSSSHEPITIPLRSHITISTDVTGGSRVWVDGDFAGRFEVFIFGGQNRLFSWSQMAFVAPLE